MLGDSSTRSVPIRARLIAQFLLGTTVGGLSTGAALGVVTALFGPLRIAPFVGVGIAIFTVMVHLRRGALALPQRRQQIPEEVFMDRFGGGLVRFGIEFGSGVRTFITSSAPYVAVGAAVALEVSFSEWLVLGACFGLGKGIPSAARVVLSRAKWARRLDRDADLIAWTPVVAITVVIVVGLLSGQL